MVFVESPWFEAWREQHLNGDAFDRLLSGLMQNPRGGDVIPGSEGLRKLRLALPGRGKRGGARVIYYYWVSAERIYLLMAYAKNRQGDLSKDQIRRLSAALKEELSHG